MIAALLSLSAFLAAIVRGAGIARDALIPGVGLVSPEEVKAAGRAARHAYLAGDRDGALAGICEVLNGNRTAFTATGTATTADLMFLTEAQNFLAWLEQLGQDWQAEQDARKG